METFSNRCMYKTKQEYLVDIAKIYGELKKDTYGERKGGNSPLPPCTNSFYVNAKKLYSIVWNMIEAFPNSTDLNTQKQIHDSERIILYELNVFRVNDNKDVDILTRTLEEYYLKIGSDLHLFLNNKL